MTEFKGIYELTESNGMENFARVALATVISKIVFRTGVVEEALFKMMAKTKCQIAASVDDTSAEDLGVMRRSKIWKASANSYTWTFSVDSSNAPKPPPDAPPSPTRKERKTENIMISTKGSFKMGEDFLITVPITGERVNSRFKRSVKGRTGILDQTTNLLEGIVETSYNLSKETLVVTWTHKATDITGTQVFRRTSKNEKDEFSELSSKSSSSKRSKSPLLGGIKGLKKKTDG